MNKRTQRLSAILLTIAVLLAMRSFSFVHAAEEEGEPGPAKVAEKDNHNSPNAEKIHMRYYLNYPGPGNESPWIHVTALPANSDVTLEPDYPSRPGGYIFRGWALSPDGFPEYMPGDIYHTGTDTPVDLYAIWGRTNEEHTHEASESVIENVIEATCTEAGSHDEVVYCAVCGEELSRDHIADPVLGHAWGEWMVAKEPTDTEEGIEKRVCARCGEEEERPLARLRSVITFDPAGGLIDGSGDPASNEYEYGEEITLPAAPVREGFEFLYWDSPEYCPGDSYVVAGSRTFTAIWQAVSSGENDDNNGNGTGNGTGNGDEPGDEPGTGNGNENGTGSGNEDVGDGTEGEGQENGTGADSVTSSDYENAGGKDFEADNDSDFWNDFESADDSDLNVPDDSDTKKSRAVVPTGDDTDLGLFVSLASASLLWLLFFKIIRNS